MQVKKSETGPFKHWSWAPSGQQIILAVRFVFLHPRATGSLLLGETKEEDVERRDTFYLSCVQQRDRKMGGGEDAKKAE